MPFLYVYNPSDFVGGLPGESGAAAAGTPVFTLTLVAGATPVRIEVNDNDLIFDEVDGTQTLQNAATINGTAYAAGTSINTAYDLLNTVTGHRVTSFHMGGDGYQQGAVDGLVSTVPLTPGSSYTFNQERTSHTQPNSYDDYVACFASGSMIQTEYGLLDVAEIAIGDMVVTLERGLQDVLWTGASTVVGTGALAPVRFQAGSIGNERDLVLSPNHRVYISDPSVQYYFGIDAALVAAKSMINGTTITQETVPEVRYHHILTSAHDIVFANGAPVETLFLGSEGRGAIGEAGRKELKTLFPQLFEQAEAMSTAHLCLRAREANILQYGWS